MLVSFLKKLLMVHHRYDISLHYKPIYMYIVGMMKVIHPQTLVITLKPVINRYEKVKCKQCSECENHSFIN